MTQRSVGGGGAERRGRGGAWAPTCVSLEFLDDLFGLKVPDVHHAVLGARHDPLQSEVKG